MSYVNGPPPAGDGGRPHREPWAEDRDPRGPYQDPRGPYQDPRGPYQEPWGGDQDPRGQHQEPRRPYRDPRGAERTALTVHTIADVAAGILGLWLVMYVFEANQGNDLVSFVQGSANWLAGWSQDLFTMETEWVRVLLNYGVPAVLYLLLGHGLAAKIRSF